MIVYDEAGNAYEVAGDEEELGAIPNMARFGNTAALRPGSAQQAASNAQATRPRATALSPSALRQALQPGRIALPAALAAAGVSEARARQIVREEMAAFQAQNPLQQVPPNQNRSGICSNPMGVGFLKFDSTTQRVLTLTAAPQRGFRGERLVVDIRRSGPTAEASPVILSKLMIGDYNQLVGGGPLPADIFANNSVGVRLDLDASYPGVIINMEFQIPLALAPGDGIFVSVGIIGSTVDITSGA